jgi:hypothetical protein
MPTSSGRHRRSFRLSVTAAESALAFQRTSDGALDFTTSQANILQLAIAQRCELKGRLALHEPTQKGHPPRLQPGDQLAGLGCDAL